MLDPDQKMASGRLRYTLFAGRFSNRPFLGSQIAMKLQVNTVVSFKHLFMILLCLLLQAQGQNHDCAKAGWKQILMSEGPSLAKSGSCEKHEQCLT